MLEQRRLRSGLISVFKMLKGQDNTDLDLSRIVVKGHGLQLNMGSAEEAVGEGVVGEGATH